MQFGVTLWYRMRCPFTICTLSHGPMRYTMCMRCQLWLKDMYVKFDVPVEPEMPLRCHDDLVCIYTYMYAVQLYSKELANVQRCPAVFNSIQAVR